MDQKSTDELNPIIMQNKAEYFILIFFVKIFSLLGIDRAAATASVLSRFLYYFVPLRKKIIRKNLTIAFPEKSEKEIKELVLSNYRSVVILLHEISCVKNTEREKFLSKIKYTNIDELNKELENNKGALLLSAHFGNWELAGVAFNAVTARPFHALAKPQRNPYANKWINDTREYYGSTVVSLGLGVREVFKVLQKGSPILMVGDQRGPSDGMRVKFFGQETAVYIGTAAIAQKTSAPIYFFLMIRQPDNTYRVTFERMHYEEVKGSKEEIIHWINQNYMSKLEAALRVYPEQWFWMHNIWKY